MPRWNVIFSISRSCRPRTKPVSDADPLPSRVSLTTMSSPMSPTTTNCASPRYGVSALFSAATERCTSGCCGA
ncbi:MAG: hypothetical protein DMF87_22765 [Acidobacteria bacterium]|nr:MAG: hypothetical protein DMF87_22765 [Acidobacteriota bacterium]